MQSVSLTNATGAFYTPVSESLGVLRGSFAMYATLQSLAMAVVTLYIPKIMDRLNYSQQLIMDVLFAWYSQRYRSECCLNLKHASSCTDYVTCFTVVTCLDAMYT